MSCSFSCVSLNAAFPAWLCRYPLCLFCSGLVGSFVFSSPCVLYLYIISQVGASYFAPAFCGILSSPAMLASPVIFCISSGVICILAGSGFASMKCSISTRRDKSRVCFPCCIILSCSAVSLVSSDSRYSVCGRIF